MSRLPLIGVIKLECISSKEKRFKHVIDEQRLQNFIANLARSRMSDNERLTLVTIFATYHYFTCRQCQAILSNFGMGNEKVQAALLLYFRSVLGWPAVHSMTKEQKVTLSKCQRTTWANEWSQDPYHNFTI